MATTDTLPHEDLNWSHPANSKIEIIDHETGLVREWLPDGSGPKTKVAIVGFAASSRADAPYDDPTWSIWGLNQLYRWVPRADRHFEIHANFMDAVVDGTDYRGWLRRCSLPIYMTQRQPDIPNSVTYPLQRVIKDLEVDYFTSTIAYEIALAIVEGFKEIALYGVDLIVNEEWAHQKPCVEFLLGLANGRGITTTIPRTSAVCKMTHRYGYEPEPSLGPLKISTLQKREGELLEERHRLMTQLHGVEGALMEARRWREYLELSARGGLVRT